MIEKKEPIQVPAGIRYLGNWNEFSFNKFPNKCILDKQLPGCGFTEYCTNGPEPVILASPRIMLINNKADQHPDDVFLVVNDMDKDPDVDKDLNKIYRESGGSTLTAKESEEQQETLLKDQRRRVYNRIKSQLLEYMGDRDSANKPMKILVTYDSYHIVKDIMREFGRFDEFYTVVDEFQSILHDSRFKSETEMQFLTNLFDVSRVMFASATPMMDQYINMLNEFDGLPFYSLDWYTQDPTRIIKPNLEVKLMRSVGERACQVIKTYLDGNFESIVVQRDGKPVTVVSNEAVLYVNSVNHITSIIKKMGLTPDQVLILCSNTEANRKKIWKKLTKKFNIGHVPNPRKGEKFPMFTFCTRTVYLGADFYSTCARTFIFSDANIDSLAVDISEDLPQILGRQRLDENPWKNSATFYYRTTANYRRMKKTDFDAVIETKKKKTEDLLNIYRTGTKTPSEKFNLAENYLKVAKSYNYKDDYVGVNTLYVKENGDDGKVVRILVPKLNNLVLVNEIRAFDIQQLDYKDRFTVFSKINNKLDTNNLINQEVELFLKNYESLTTKRSKLKYLCECGLPKQAINIILSQIPDSDEIKSYYVNLGPERLFELGYITSRIEKELGIITFSEDLLRESIYSNFNIGDKLQLTEIKNKLSDIYNKINYSAAPKATDISEFFNVKSVQISIIDDAGKKKRVHGYEILSVK